MSFAKRVAYNYHDAGLLGITIGPRHEVTLHVVLDPVWNDGSARECHIRIGDIQNWEDAEAFFQQVPAARQADAHRDTIIRLGWTPGKDLEVELSQTGYLQINRPKVTEK